jgi:serine/threonine protein kinase
MSFNTNQPPYVDLRNRIAERTDSIVAWVGSGLSVPAGLPTWPQLKTALIKDLDQKAATLTGTDAAFLRAKMQVVAYEPNPWTAFEVLKEGLGEASFVTSIRRALGPALTSTIPSVYLKLWRLRVGGMLNLNLDKLASRAYSAVHAGGAVSEFNGRSAGDYVYLLKTPNPFIGHLHGTHDHASSWVFTKGDLRTLLKAEGYKTFVEACLASRTVVFIGMSADDAAAGGHFERLHDAGIDLGAHYWITSRGDLATDAWAQKAGIQIIRYAARDNNHAELDELLDDLLAFVPHETVAPPVKPSTIVASPRETLTPQDLAKQDAESIRTYLNAKAAEILSSGSPNADKEYADFCRIYRTPIYRAWDVTAEPPDNVLFGYKLLESQARGAFGQVYRAEAPSGDTVAIKVLHGEVRSNSEMLQSFRRGVNSMRILSMRGVQGMVAYLEASEIPACTIMDFVEGPNLVNVVESKTITDWDDILFIGIELATILRRAHLLPERVLHRDVKPANVMLADFYTTTAWKVVVLDFDLSWHKDAMGLSIDTSNTMSGFLAPEQVDRTSKDSTRNALVDSFGTGMTLYYLRSGKEPIFAQQKHADWREVLTQNISVHKCNAWKSLPRRFARLVEWSTRQAQAERWDMAQILGELTQLRQALNDSASVQSSELLAEELAARCDLGHTYQWNRDLNSALWQLPTGLKVSVRGNESDRSVSIEIEWVDRGFGDHKKVGKWIPTALDQAASALRAAGFHITETAKTATLAHSVATAHASQVRTTLDKAASALSNAIDAFSFE